MTDKGLEDNAKTLDQLMEDAVRDIDDAPEGSMEDNVEDALDALDDYIENQAGVSGDSGDGGYFDDQLGPGDLQDGAPEFEDGTINNPNDPGGPPMVNRETGDLGTDLPSPQRGNDEATEETGDGRDSPTSEQSDAGDGDPAGDGSDGSDPADESEEGGGEPESRRPDDANAAESEPGGGESEQQPGQTEQGGRRREARGRAPPEGDWTPWRGNVRVRISVEGTAGEMARRVMDRLANHGRLDGVDRSEIEREVNDSGFVQEDIARSADGGGGTLVFDFDVRTWENEHGRGIIDMDRTRTVLRRGGSTTIIGR